MFLWEKLLNENISGKILNIIKNIYETAKSSVMVRGDKSEFFKLDTGVRQGENLSPILFSLFLNDMKSHLAGDMEGMHSIIDNIKTYDETDDSIDEMFSLFILLYADDTAIFSENAEGLQKGLDSVKTYCDNWNLKLNVDKCKVVIFF